MSTNATELQRVQAQLSADLLRKEQLTGELAQVQERIIAHRNVLNGVQLGMDVVKEAAIAEQQRRAQEPPAVPAGEQAVGA